uniref:Uncharacterized protein n=1 Tax=Avena sativa TaxID=4498 RepID=A0ACD5XRS7_AVESA
MDGELAAVTLLPIGESAPIYEKLLATFPTAVKYWKQYVEAYIASNDEETAKQIFSRCLLTCPHVNLWRCYINFIKRVNNKRGSEGLEETKKAFDFMLNYVGNDVASGPVWMEYIAFLKSMPVVTPQEESHRMTTIRKVYQKAILVPTSHVEQLWKDYDNFENSVSRTLAKGLLSEYQPKFNSARAVYRERKKYIDDIDWSMLAIPPTVSYKEEQQCMAWKRLLTFEKGNPQRIDATAANRRITFTYEQCLMYLYHHPDVWYDYATWHAKNGSTDSAIKIFQRAIKALPGSEVLKYAFAELEESIGAIQPAKTIYESLVAENASMTSLAHIQFIRFLRRTEGIEAARKYFLEARKLPSCTYHVYVAYATMSFCLDKDAKIAQNVFEAGLKRFMQEPGYVLEYADFLCRLNDDRNVRALFERALSLLPPEESIEVWKRFAQFEQIYGDLSSMLKVEQRRKEALSKTSEDVLSSLDNTLYDVVSRYNYMDLWPCSSKELDYLSRQEWLAKNMFKKSDKSVMLTSGGGATLDKGYVGVGANAKLSPQSARVVRPETSRMIIYDPRQIKGPVIAATSSGYTKEVDEIFKMLSPPIMSFITNLPAIEGPSPDIDIVLSVLLQSTLPTGHDGGKPAGAANSEPLVPRNQNGPVHRPPRDGQPTKRKGIERQEEEDTAAAQSRARPRDIFRLRQIQRSRGGVAPAQSGSAAMSSGSMFSGEQSANSSS